MYNRGTKVVIKVDLKLGTKYLSKDKCRFAILSESMMPYLGMAATVVRRNKYGMLLDVDEELHVWSYDMLDKCGKTVCDTIKLKAEITAKDKNKVLSVVMIDPKCVLVNDVKLINMMIKLCPNVINRFIKMGRKQNRSFFEDVEKLNLVKLEKPLFYTPNSFFGSFYKKDNENV